MLITDYHAKLYAHELKRRFPSDSIERFTAALMDSQIDLNPHQVDAALFAFRSPLSKGAILADEVGLGKTIEAGIVLSQKWAERKRRILLIVPSSLRKQWQQELIEKFYLPSTILESQSFNKAIKKGTTNPFDVNEIVITSFHFAKNKSEFVTSLRWDLVIIDEAHRLRNVYKKSNVIANELKTALQHSPKLLLTATPLQNSLLELFGLVSFIDEHVFGDIKSFRSQFTRLNSEGIFQELKQRISPVCKRTLRRQVLEYIKYTERKAYTQEFIPTEEEEVLYDLVSEYLRKPDLQALPASQRTLMTLVMRKLLASSTFAIAGALDSLANKLTKKLKDHDDFYNNDEDIQEDFEAFDEEADEYDIELQEDDESPEPLTELEIESINSEIDELRSFYDLAMQITHNAKGESLLQALKIGMEKAQALGGAEKAVIFTESRRTQNYLAQLLTENGYEGEIVLFNGTNNDDVSKEIYKDWKIENEGSKKVTGSRAVDIRAAIVDHFRSNAKIMIATEAAAEGINLQFCSMVVNYDLPWNPQRIEQRIGRCHRYGQKHDVVVVNFLNKNNAAEQRVYQLLSEKFQLFNGVFGASDEVLGAIESGVDFEKRIMEIYQTCRSIEDIQKSFDLLQSELSSEIDESLKHTRQKLLENFDVEVAEKLNVYKAEAQNSLNRYEKMLWELSSYELIDLADFDIPSLSFDLNTSPVTNIQTGKYCLKHQDDRGYHFRIQHPLAAWIIEAAQKRSLEPSQLIFDYSGVQDKITILEPLIGLSGSLSITRFTVKALEIEDYLICSAITDSGKILDADQARRLFNLPAKVKFVEDFDTDQLDEIYSTNKQDILSDISERNAVFFEEEMDKLDGWAKDKRNSLKLVLKDYDDQIKEMKKKARLALNLPEKLEVQKKIRKLDSKRDEAWREYDQAARDIELQKDELIDQVEQRMRQEIGEALLFYLQWKLI